MKTGKGVVPVSGRTGTGLSTINVGNTFARETSSTVTTAAKHPPASYAGLVLVVVVMHYWLIVESGWWKEPLRTFKEPSKGINVSLVICPVLLLSKC